MVKKLEILVTVSFSVEYVILLALRDRCVPSCDASLRIGRPVLVLQYVSYLLYAELKKKTCAFSLPYINNNVLDFDDNLFASYQLWLTSSSMLTLA